MAEKKLCDGWKCTEKAEVEMSHPDKDTVMVCEKHAGELQLMGCEIIDA